MRISTTTIESFRLWRDPEQEWMPEADLIDQIKGIWKPNHKAALGKAFGLVLETPDRYRVPRGYVCNGFQFGEDVMAPCLALYDRRGVCEAKATKQYGEHTVVARADQLIGTECVESKTTLGYFDFDKYAGSCQWRFMADIFQPSQITYRVFCLDEATNGVISLRGIETFTLYPYVGLSADCTALVEAFAEYVTRRKLTGYLNRSGLELEHAA